VRGEDGEGFARLCELTRHERQAVWEAALACLVNLSHLPTLRPSLGNAGAVEAIVDKVSTSSLSEKEKAHSVTALCLYCRESVNRMKLREFGGLRLFVALLDDQESSALHERIVNSLLQYAYDDLSLRVLQHVGLVKSLVRLLNTHIEANSVEHNCAREICEEEKDSQEEAKIENKEVEHEDKMSSVHDDNDVADMEDVQDAEQDDVPLPEEDDASEEANQGEGKEDGESQRESEDADAQPSRFRVNSPSYQAVQQEFEEYLRIRNEQQEQQRLQAALDWDDDASFMHSPDRSPFPWAGASPGYSPAHSSAACSPPGSPTSAGRCSPAWADSPGSPARASLTGVGEAPKTPEREDKGKEEPEEEEEEHPSPAYSPVERFSGDENEEEPAPSTSASGPPKKKRLRLTSDSSPARLVTAPASPDTPPTTAWDGGPQFPAQQKSPTSKQHGGILSPISLVAPPPMTLYSSS